MVKKKILKYSKSKFSSYLELNKIVMNFIQRTGGYTDSFSGYKLQNSNYLSFILAKNVNQDIVKVHIRYGGVTLGLIRKINSSWEFYRYDNERQKCSPKYPDLVNVGKLSKVLSNILNYKLDEGISHLEIIIDNNWITYSKYDSEGRNVEVAKSKFYINGRQNYMD